MLDFGSENVTYCEAPSPLADMDFVPQIYLGHQNKKKLTGVQSNILFRCKIKFWHPPIEYKPGANIQWIFRWIMTLLSCWILSTLLNVDTFLSRNFTGIRYVDGSDFHVKLWPWVKIPRWYCDPGSEFHMELWHRAGSKFNVESWHRVIIQHGIKTTGS